MQTKVYSHIQETSKMIENEYIEIKNLQFLSLSHTSIHTHSEISHYHSFFMNTKLHSLMF